ncbi:MAG: hypothetical protein ACTSUE_10765 [Promethearchaeota archaeon]
MEGTMDDSRLPEGEEEKEKDQERPVNRKGTRIYNAPPDTFDPNTPRLGRRESEPHSDEVTWLHDVLVTNFPGSRTIWDLHHYFTFKHTRIDMQFDISFFKDLKIKHTLSSYKAEKYGGRVPDVAFNILSKSTWRADVGEHVDYCRMLGIKVYVLFAPFKVATKPYDPPFLRVYVANGAGNYEIRELREITTIEGDDNGAINEKHVMELGDDIPFRLGIMKRNVQHEDEKPLFKLILIDLKQPLVLPSALEKEKARADDEKARADAEKARADAEKARADAEKARADAEKARADELEKRLKTIEVRSSDA